MRKKKKSFHIPEKQSNVTRKPLNCLIISVQELVLDRAGQLHGI